RHAEAEQVTGVGVASRLEAAYCGDPVVQAPPGVVVAELELARAVVVTPELAHRSGQVQRTAAFAQWLVQGQLQLAALALQLRRIHAAAYQVLREDRILQA